MTDFTGLSRLIIVCGHYGSGKTNFSLNLAYALSRLGRKVTIADMDVVNPYFRSSDYAARLSEEGISVIAPALAGTTLDVPALSPEIYRAFAETEGTVIFDAGGDDAGATALGGFCGRFQEKGYDMLYVINQCRPETAEIGGAVQILREIETASRLRATAIVNNSHLSGFTTTEVIRHSVPYAERIAALTHLPLLCTTASVRVAKTLCDIKPLFPVDIWVSPLWDRAFLER